MFLTAYSKGITAQKEAHGALNDEGLTDKSSSASLPLAHTTGKRFSTLTARLAIAGFTATQINAANGTLIYCVARWGMEKMLPDLDAVQALLTRIGGVK